MSKLHEAASIGDMELLEEQINNGVNPSEPDLDWGGRTPLHIASSYGFKRCVFVLIKAGADLNAQTATGWTPAHYASEAGSADCLRCLLSAGCEIKPDWSGDTPLRMAEIYDHTECIDLLEEHNAIMASEQESPAEHRHKIDVDSTVDSVSNTTGK